MTKIDPLASVSPNAKIGENVQIGPYAFIDDNVEIGDGCVILPHATIFSYVKMGKNCTVYPGAVVGAIPQDLKFDGEITYVEIGDRVNGDDTLIMSYVHVAHDCNVGKHCILVSYTGIAGETDVDDWAIIGGGSKAHQFSRIGAHAMVGGVSKINKDIPPYALCGRDPICYVGVNIVGLRRRGFSTDQIRNIKDIYDTIYFQGMNVSDGLAKVESGFPQSEERDTIINFIRGSKRGIVRAIQPGERPEVD